ncbi:MAG: hypothetical protein QXP53_01335 [Candidatus Pacearchaeota archaeon]
MINIYEIPHEKIQGIKRIIEAKEEVSEELDFEIETKDEKGGKKEKAKKWKINEFARQSYTLKDAKSLGIDKKCSYLYINASEEFFKKNEKILLNAGAKKLSGNEFEKVKKTIEEQESATSSGVGFIFG